MPSSSSDSDDNAEQRRLAEALDPDFLGVGKHKLMTNGERLQRLECRNDLLFLKQSPMDVM